MARNLVALVAGLVFGLGLGVSQMVNPAKVLGFLDIAGDWDPTLAFVMGGALAVTLISFRLILGSTKPLLAETFAVPARGDLDARLLGGTAVFGIGWGLVGFCPGPAISSLAYGQSESVIFVVAMAVGAALAGLIREAGGQGRVRPA